MHEPNPQKPTSPLHVKLLGHVERIVISVPSKKSALAQLRSQLQRSVPFHPHCKRSAALLKLPRFADAIELQPRNRQKSRNHLLRQSPLMETNRRMRSHNSRSPARASRSYRMSPQILPIVHTSPNPGNALVIQSPPLPAIRNA